MSVSVPLVADARSLVQLAERLRAAGSFALDTEFHRERTYSARLCLVQVATESECALVDPIALQDLGPLLELLHDPAVEVVLHAGEQDLEIFYGMTSRPPLRIYDTQVAAALAGWGDQVGYAHLVGKVLGVHLAKTETGTDWSRRPLSPAQVEYALDDVRFLPRVKAGLDRRLAQLGRAGWLAEELERLEDAATYRRAPEDAWTRVRRTGSLRPQALAILRELGKWRENTAISSDKPRGWILRDEAMVEIARRAPTKLEDLEGIRHLDVRDRERHGKSILQCVVQGLSVPPEGCPKPLGEVHDNPENNVLVDLLDTVLRAVARGKEISPTVLGTRTDLLALVEHCERNGNPAGRPAARLLSGWRRELVGDVLLATIRGEAGVRYDPRSGQVVVNQ